MGKALLECQTDKNEEARISEDPNEQGNTPAWSFKQEKYSFILLTYFTSQSHTGKPVPRDIYQDVKLKI